MLVQIQQLIDELLIHDDNYFNGTPEISDAEYDQLKLQLRKLDPTNSYLTKVGAPVYGTKYKLPYPMGSLDQKYNDNDLSNWIQKYKIEDVIVTDKLDGFSCLLVYNQLGILTNAYSRGDGIEGSDIMQHIGNMSAVPSKLHGKHNIGAVAIRGEIIISPIIFIKKYATKYKNPRNFASGIMNRKEASLEILNDISFIAYEIVSDTELSKEDSLNRLSEYGFDIPNYIKIHSKELQFDKLNDLIIQCKKNSEYELDGIVITINDLPNVQQISQSQSINPEDSIKWKLAGVNTVEAIVNFIEWNKSKNGLLKPRVHLIPIDIGGVTVTHATGHNARFIKDNNIGSGSVVLLERGGDVIPSILKNLKPTQADLPTNMEWEWTSNDKGEQVEIAIIDKNDPEVIFRQVLDFCTSLEVDQLKDASLRTIFETFKMTENDYTTNLSILFDLLPHEWESALGVNGGKIYNSLHRRLQNISIPVLVGSLNYFGTGFGVRKAKTLFDQVSFKELVDMSIDDIAALHGFDIKTATNIFNGIPQVEKFLYRFDDYIEFKEEEEKQTVLNNIVVVMTGFRDPELQKKIESLGGKVGSSVSGKTTHLLQKDPNSTSGKTEKAKEVGAKIMSPDQFKDEFNL